MELSYSTVRLQLRSPFAIAHGRFAERYSVLVRVQDEDLSGSAEAGFGEIPIVPYYGITPDEAVVHLRLLWKELRAGALSDGRRANWADGCSMRSPEFWSEGPPAGQAAAALSLQAEKQSGFHPFVRSALSSALLEFAAVVKGCSTADILGLGQVRSVQSSFTIAERSAKTACELAATLPGVVLKVKAGFPEDVKLVSALKGCAPDNTLWADCNGGWSAEEAVEKAARMAGLGVSLLEEPFYRDWQKLGELARQVNIPVLADESLCSLDDVEALLAHTPENTGAVIKVSKHGGPWMARKIIRRLKEAGRPYMLGQMVESSIGTAGALCFASGARWVDLDGPVLIADDPGLGLEIRRGFVGRKSGRVIPSGRVKFLPVKN